MTAPVRETAARVPEPRDYIIASVIAEATIWAVDLQLRTLLEFGKFCGPDMVLAEIQKIHTFVRVREAEIGETLRGKR